MDQGILLAITDEEFDLIRRLIKANLGIHLTDAKRSLVAGRLQNFLTDRGFANFMGYYSAVLRDDSGKELSALADRITTNHTYFNRENDHFDYLYKSALPDLTADRLRPKGKKSLRLWCAASSTGEEAYMLGMLVMEFLGADYSNWDAGVLATDISDKALQEAKAGIYSEENIQKLPPQLIARYFQKLPTGHYKANAKLIEEITFRRFNLINPEYPFRTGFDVIFCRNVMIYFDTETKETLIGRLHKYTKPGGYLFVGHSESLDRKTCPFQYVRPGVYRKDKDDA